MDQKSDSGRIILRVDDRQFAVIAETAVNNWLTSPSLDCERVANAACAEAMGLEGLACSLQEAAGGGLLHIETLSGASAVQGVAFAGEQQNTFFPLRTMHAHDMQQVFVVADGRDTYRYCVDNAQEARARYEQQVPAERRSGEPTVTGFTEDVEGHDAGAPYSMHIDGVPPVGGVPRLAMAVEICAKQRRRSGVGYKIADAAGAEIIAREALEHAAPAAAPMSLPPNGIIVLTPDEQLAGMADSMLSVGQLVVGEVWSEELAVRVSCCMRIESLFDTHAVARPVERGITEAQSAGALFLRTDNPPTTPDNREQVDEVLALLGKLGFVGPRESLRESLKRDGFAYCEELGILVRTPGGLKDEDLRGRVWRIAYIAPEIVIGMLRDMPDSFFHIKGSHSLADYPTRDSIQVIADMIEYLGDFPYARPFDLMPQQVLDRLGAEPKRGVSFDPRVMYPVRPQDKQNIVMETARKLVDRHGPSAALEARIMANNFAAQHPDDEHGQGLMQQVIEQTQLLSMARC